MSRLLIALMGIASIAGCSANSLLGSNPANSNLSSASCSYTDAPPVSIQQLEEDMIVAGKLKLDPHVVVVAGASSLRGSLAQSYFWNSAFEPKALKLSHETKLDVLYDLQCLSEQSSADLRTFALREKVEPQVFQNTKLPLRYFQWEAPYDMSVMDVAREAARDPCLIEVSNAVIAYPSVTPNDSNFSSQAHHTAINSSASWDTFFHSTNGITSTTVIAIIDTGGAHAHNDLLANRWLNSDEVASNATDDDGNGYVDDLYGYNFASDIADPSPISWSSGGEVHGTHVAGISAARWDNGTGVAGVMGQNVQIMHLNVFGASEGASSSNIGNAILYAINNGARIINLSLGGVGKSSTYSSALTAAVDAGVTVIMAAGNSSVELTESLWFSPASYGKALNGAMAVAAVSVSDEALSSYSNYSASFVEISAPGNDSSSLGILSTMLANTYGRLQGTSMASPVVAGAAALAYGFITTRGGSATPALIETLLGDSSELMSTLAGKVKGCRALDLNALATTINSRYP
ncbi:MAG: S8 family serine peptidase [Bdellovibrionales bacterium]